MRKGLGVTGIFLLVVILLPSAALGQGCCTGGSPMLSNLGLPASSNKQLDILLSHDVNVLQDLIEGSRKLQDDTRNRFTYSTLLEVNYGITDRFTVTGLFSHIVQRRKINSGGRVVEDISTQGLGDIALLVKYNILKTTGPTTLSVGAGPKLPTGRSTLSQDGILLPADLQPGTGAVDAIFWGYFAQNTLFKKRGSLSIITTYRYTTLNDRYGFGTQLNGYKFGNELLSTVAIGRQSVIGSQIFDYSLSAQYRYVGPDRFAGNIQPSTGGHWANLVPSIRWSFSPVVALQVAGNIPVYRNLTDVQLTTSYKVSGGIYFKLKFDRKNELNILE